MCKFHVSTTYHSFDFSPEIPPSKMPSLNKIWPWKPPKVLQMSPIIHFYYQMGFKYIFLSTHSWNTDLVHPTITNMAAPRAAMFRTSSRRFFSSLKVLYTIECYCLCRPIVGVRKEKLYIWILQSCMLIIVSNCYQKGAPCFFAMTRIF